MPVKQKDMREQGGLWRRKKVGSDTADGITLRDIGYGAETADMHTSESRVSLATELGGTSKSDNFQREVANKSSTLLIGRQEAETEVFTDILVKKQGNVDKALLYVVSSVKLESKIQLLVNNLIHRGAYTSTRNNEFKTPLHFALERGLNSVAVKLLENEALPHSRDKDGTLPLKIAMDHKNDEMCATLLAYMPNYFVRNLFLSDGSQNAEFSFHELLKSEMQTTIRSVLDCMIEAHSELDGIKVYYNILECDETGRPPKMQNKITQGFDSKSKSPLQIIAKEGNKNIVYHDVVRLLIRRKWKAYARRRFELNAFQYILSLFCITYSAIVAVSAEDPVVYDNPLQISRAVLEVISMIMVVLTMLTEFNQLRRHRLEYFYDAFNWFDFSSAMLFIAVVPLRYTHNNRQWHVFAFAYLLWTLRIFKFAAVFRQTGAYAQILFRILAYDFTQFGIVFLVILLAFSGSFFLALRGDGDLTTHNETSTFWAILFVGIRSLTEAQPVVEYTGDEGYGTVSMLFMLCFLFTCIVLLLNILIAQLTDTYQKVQQDAQRGLEVNRAWIVARVELNSFFFFGTDFRTSKYTEFEDIKKLKDVLTKWDSPPINEMNKYVRDIWDSLDNHKMNLLTIQHRMARQENALRNIQEQLRCVISMQTTGTNLKPPRSKFYGSESDLQQNVITEGNGIADEETDIDIKGIIPNDQLDGAEKTAGNGHGPLQTQESLDLDDLHLDVDNDNDEKGTQDDQL